MAARYTLHGIWLSGPTYKVGLLLSMLGEPFDYVHINLREGEHKKPEYLAKNYFGQVPCLLDNRTGRHMCQSASILEYLAEQGGKFGGADEAERVRIREWMFWDFDRLASNIYRARSIKLGFRQAHEAIAEMSLNDGKVALKVLDDHLAGRSWMVGNGPTIADIDLYGVVSFAPAGGFSLADYPNISSWMKRFEALKGVGAPEQVLPKESKAA